MNHYETLCVEKEATAEEIKASYRRLASKHHPDREGGNEEAFKSLQTAYEVLSNPSKRAHYDQFGDSPSKAEVTNKIIAEVLMQLIDSGILNLKYQSPIEVAQQYFTARMLDIKENIKQIRVKNKRYGFVKNRLKSNNEALFETLRGRRMQNIHDIRKLKAEYKTGEQALKLLSEYEYEVDVAKTTVTTASTIFYSYPSVFS